MLARAGFFLRHFLGRLAFGVLGVADGVGDLRTADVHEVLRLIVNPQHLQGVEVEAHLVERFADELEHLVRELDAVLVHLLGRQVGDDAAEQAFERLLRRGADVLERQVQEALDRVVDEARIARDFDVGDRMHVERNAADRQAAVHL